MKPTSHKLKAMANATDVTPMTSDTRGTSSMPSSTVAIPRTRKHSAAKPLMATNTAVPTRKAIGVTPALYRSDLETLDI
jgi:hypothetical protein